MKSTRRICFATTRENISVGDALVVEDVELETGDHITLVRKTEPKDFE